MGVKLGTDNNWAIKDGNLLAYNDASGRFFNKEFDFARGSRATYVGRDGLIKNSGEQPTNLVQNGDFSQLGSELIVNGDFAADSYWTKGTGWSIADGKAISDGVSSDSNLHTTSAFYSGSTPVKMTINVTDYVSGGLKVYLSSTNFTEITANGNYTFYTTADRPDGKLYLKSINFIGSIDNVSVKEVGQNWTFGTGWSIGEDKAVSVGSNVDAYLSQSGLVAGKTYKVAFDILDYVSGTLSVRAANEAQAFLANSNGSYVGYVTSISSISIGFRSAGSGFIGSVSNISVQEIDTNTPRIDFTDDVNGHLLLEPQRTNKITNSENFSAWSVSSNAILTYESDVISPDGTSGVYRLNLPATSATFIASNAISISSVGTFSCYVKSANTGNNDFGFYKGTGSIPSPFTATNEWQRFELDVDSSTVNMAIINGADTFASDIYIWGAQAEEGYATSYIPTYGSVQTRLGETCTNSGSAQDFNSEEGVLYAEIAAFNQSNFNYYITIGQSTATGILGISFYTGNNKVLLDYWAGGVETAHIESVSDITQLNKFAICYNGTSIKGYINGVSVWNTTVTAFAANAINKLNFNFGGGSNSFYGKTKDLRYYNTALTDAELIALTT